MAVGIFTKFWWQFPKLTTAEVDIILRTSNLLFDEIVITKESHMQPVLDWATERQIKVTELPVEKLPGQNNTQYFNNVKKAIIPNLHLCDVVVVLVPNQHQNDTLTCIISALHMKVVQIEIITAPRLVTANNIPVIKAYHDDNTRSS